MLPATRQQSLQLFLICHHAALLRQTHQSKYAISGAHLPYRNSYSKRARPYHSFPVPLYAIITFIDCSLLPLNNKCGSLILAFHDQSEADGVYTAGSINLDVMDSSGQINIDPNATNLTY